ncbi:alpha/beta fold hydrolase [Paenibacillus ehimensis]|uniref:alpha/beta fold hydrolase n=1 Tax=Paenibacillus ehimensis TaxID=79264 RepID=UPI000FD94CF4|nr:alpha/beta hydrolase [Paenibacillus ehimensis]MEC0212427.1 alpha/beta hydrolase [Paenibacillus ehimensis]
MSTQEGAQEKIGLVLLTGAGLDSRIWSKVVDGLDYPHLMANYPRREDSIESRNKLSLDEYVTHVKRQVDEWGSRRFVIVAHSLGGVIGLRLASELNDRLAGYISVAAAVPKNGGSFLSVLPFPKRILISTILRIIGTKPPESAIRAGLCSDLSAAQAAEIINGFTPEAVRVYTDRSNVSLPMVPTLYVKLTKDKEFSPSLQNKMISNLSPQWVRSLDTGHLPMLSDPDGLRAVLGEFMADVR